MLNAKVAVALVCGSVAAALSGCSTISVKTDSAPGASVAVCHTYAFAHEHVANADHPGAYGNPLNAERLRVAVQNNLAAKGIQPADAKTADCMVGYAMGSRQVFDDYYGGYGGFGWGAGWGWGGGWGRGRYGGAWGYDGPWVQNETRIAVDLFDAKSRKPIWHASASQTVNELSGPNAEVKINAAAAAIFAKFPAGGTGV